MPRSVSYQAPAKLNLALSVGPPIRDAGPASGMHPICSWMVTVDFFDELHLTRLEDDRLSRYAILWHADAKRRSEINWSIKKDLAVRAHLALQSHVGRTLPVQLKLEKRIPVGGGLGGGSSDAAAMLRAVNDLFDLTLSLDELSEIGATLGSDVPFLLHGGSAVVEGLGETITRHAPPANGENPAHVVLIFPEASCPTAAVYGRFDETMSANGKAKLRSGDVAALASGGLSHLRPDSPFNDLANAAMLTAPQLRDDLASVSELAQRPAHITGSGSSLFVICDDEPHAAALAQSIEARLKLPAAAVRSAGTP